MPAVEEDFRKESLDCPTDYLLKAAHSFIGSERPQVATKGWELVRQAKKSL